MITITKHALCADHHPGDPMLSALCARVAEELPSRDTLPQHISNVLHAMARLGHHPGKAWLVRMSMEVHARVADFSAQVRTQNFCSCIVNMRINITLCSVCQHESTCMQGRLVYVSVPPAHGRLAMPVGLHVQGYGNMCDSTICTHAWVDAWVHAMTSQCQCYCQCQCECQSAIRQLH